MKQHVLFPEMENEGTAGLEPATSCLEGRCSDPTELRPRSRDDSSEARQPAFSRRAAASLEAAVEFASFAEMPIDEFLNVCRCRYLVHALELEDGHQIRAARRLGTHRNSVVRWMREFRLDSRGFKPNKKRPGAVALLRRKARRA